MEDNDIERVMLTKELLLKGTKHREEVETEVGVFTIRPLNKGEQARADSLAVRGIKTKGKASNAKDPDMEMDMEGLIKNDWDVKFHVIACGLSVDKRNKFSPGEVRMMDVPNKIMNALAERIKEISGMKEVKDLLDSFQPDGSGERDGPTDPGGELETDGQDGEPDSPAK